MMRIETTFSIGDTVYAITQIPETRSEPCPRCCGDPPEFADHTVAWCDHCQGEGRVNVERREAWCIDEVCRRVGYGGAYEKRAPGGEQIVGLVSVKWTKEGVEEKYMLSGTGIGSGTVWPVEKLFPTAEAAQAECYLRNEGMPWKGEQQ